MESPPWSDAVYLGFRAYRLMKVTQSVYIVTDCRGDNSLIINFNTRSTYNMIDEICVRDTVYAKITLHVRMDTKQYGVITNSMVCARTYMYFMMIHMCLLHAITG